MEVILLERIGRLGQMGDVVRVKDGYARNFLLPRGKALRATDGNRKLFETQRAQLEARNLELKTEAGAVAEKLEGRSFVTIRQAGDTGQLYGSVSTRDIADALIGEGFHVARSQITLNAPSGYQIASVDVSGSGSSQMRTQVTGQGQSAVIINPCTAPADVDYTVNVTTAAGVNIPCHPRIVNT